MENLLVTGGDNGPAKVRTVEISPDLHVPLHGRFYPDKADTVGNITANGQIVTLNVTNTTGLVLALRAVTAISGIICSFETSLDSTNGVDGTWYQMQCQRSNAMDVLETGTSTLSATPSNVWNVPVAGVNWFRVRCSAYTSGTLEVRLSPCDDLMFPSRTSAVSVTGNVAHDSAVTGSPVRIGAKAVTSMPSAVSAANDVHDLITTMQGALVVAPNSTPDSRRRGSAALTTTGDVAVLAAAGTGLRHNVSDIVAINTGTAVDLILKDGTTEIFRLTLPQNVPVCISLNSPLMGTANTAVNCALSAAGTVRVNLMGFIG